MAVTSTLRDDHVRVVTMDFPPVNALPVQGWYDVAGALDEAARDLETHVVVLRAEGRGFNAGVDIKEMQTTSGFEALIGNADCIVAADDAYFGVPEVDRGALGAATHLARLVPPHLMRTLYFTGRTITAEALVPHGSVLQVVQRGELDDAALEVAGEIARKDTRVIRAAKEALNGIDPVDVNKSYRFEQGFTMELNLAGVSDELRDEFAGTDKARGR
jgi:enoyl-CoA hydratase